jgi:hypothetical protein
VPGTVDAARRRAEVRHVSFRAMSGNRGGLRRMTEAAAAVAVAAIALAGCGSGGATTSEDRSAVRAIAQQYLDGYRTRDGAMVCEILSSQLRSALEESLDVSCEQSVEERTSGGPDQGSAQQAWGADMLNTARISSVTFDRGVGAVDAVGQVGGTDFDMTLLVIREDGRWVVGGLEDGPSGTMEEQLAAARDEAAAAFRCPVDAAAVRDIVGKPMEVLPDSAGTCRFGRRGPGHEGEDDDHPFVMFRAHAIRDLSVFKSGAGWPVDPGEAVAKRPRWGRGAFSIDYAGPDMAITTAYVPGDGTALVMHVVLPPGEGASRERERIADTLATTIRRR